jgi:hypothetical protein
MSDRPLGAAERGTQPVRQAERSASRTQLRWGVSGANPIAGEMRGFRGTEAQA